MLRLKTDRRYELKYVLHRDEMAAVLADMADYLEPDAYGDRQGQYLVTSLYFDTADFKAYWDKIDGHKFRRKVRVRVYGDQLVTGDTPVFAEIKQRLDKTLEKRRVLLPYAWAVALDKLDRFETSASLDRSVLDEIHYLAETLQLQPACVVNYSRLAFNGTDYDPGLRVTFDTDLQGRVHDLTLESKSYARNEYFLPPYWCIMEIKINHRVPYWLTEIIGKHRCVLRRVSKYCAALEHSRVIRTRQRIAL